MKQKLFRILSVVSVVLILSVVTACDKTDNDSGNDNEPVISNDNVVDDDTDNSVVGDDTSEEDNENQDENDVIDPEGDDVSVLETISLEGGIKDIYNQINIIAGTCLSDIMIIQSDYSDIIVENFDSITLENLMKPDYMLNKSKSIESGDIVVEFGNKTKNLLDWAKTNNLSARGHVIVWHSQTPNWIFYEDFDNRNSLVDRNTMLSRMESYIKQTFEQLDVLGYTDTFYAYDIVNEALMEDGTYRDSLWKQIIGDDYIWYAFYYADKYAPESIGLYYNDYNEQFKTDVIIELVNSLVDEDGRYLIDGIGCQGHLYTQDSIDEYISTLKAFNNLGIDVQITELDVSLGTWMEIEDSTEENLVAQGQYYYELVSRIAMENAAGNTNVSGITFWGFADNLSWRNTRYPLLFDKNLEPKYSYYGAKLDYDNAGY